MTTAGPALARKSVPDHHLRRRLSTKVATTTSAVLTKVVVEVVVGVTAQTAAVRGGEGRLAEAWVGCGWRKTEVTFA